MEHNRLGVHHHYTRCIFDSAAITKIYCIYSLNELGFEPSSDPTPYTPYSMQPLVKYWLSVMCYISLVCGYCFYVFGIIVMSNICTKAL